MGKRVLELSCKVSADVHQGGYSGQWKECEQGQKTGKGLVRLGNCWKFGVNWAGWQTKKPS